MGALEGVQKEELLEALDQATDPKAVKRLMTAIAYLDGVSVSEVSNRYDIPQSTLYYWLDRFERQPIEQAITDETRPGRPPKLTLEQRSAVEEILSETPEKHGYNGNTWAPEEVQELVANEFDVEYSVGHVRRLFDL